MDPRLLALLDTLGMDEIRQDAKYTAALEQQLEYVKAQTYDIKYPELRARRFIPLDTSVPPGAETVAYQQWDEFGMAKILSNYAEDLPLVTALAEKFFQGIESLGQAYDYSIQDLARSAMSGSQLETRKATAARKFIERRIDDIAAVGYPAAKMKGFVNHPNVAIASATSDGTSARWVGGRTLPKAPEDIKKDMADSQTTIWVDTKQTFEPDTIVLPPTEFAHIANTDNRDNSDKSILNSFMDRNLSITNVDYWHKLAEADAAGTGPRMVTYKRSSEVLELVIPREFEQLPPQARMLSFVVPCHARCGGVVVRYPVAMLYTDGI
jgi:hypothetical protein